MNLLLVRQAGQGGLIEVEGRFQLLKAFCIRRREMDAPCDGAAGLEVENNRFGKGIEMTVFFDSGGGAGKIFDHQRADLFVAIVDA